MTSTTVGQLFTRYALAYASIIIAGHIVWGMP